jgi:hypothetical protein
MQVKKKEAGVPFDPLTRFVARHVAGAVHDGLCFGDPVQKVARRKSAVYYFRPGQRFGVLWWRRDFHGRQYRIFAAVEALPVGEPGHHLPGIHAVVEVHALMHQLGPAGREGAVDQLLDLIEDLKCDGTDTAGLPGEFWFKTQQRLVLKPVLQRTDVEDA